MRRLIPVLLLCGCIMPAGAVTVTDDTGHRIALTGPAQRIVTLSPHTTELAFQAGAGHLVVAVSPYSDHPPAARDLPKLGAAAQGDMESLLALQPDLALVWASATPRYRQEQLKRLGIAVFVSEPRTLDDIAHNLEQIGQLAGTEEQAGRAAQVFRQRLAALSAAPAERTPDAPPISVFYQVWPSPLMTVNGQHVISDIVRRCGGRNAVADFPILSGRIDEEQVLLRNPQVIIAARSFKQEAPHARWQRWPALSAVSNRRLFDIPADSMHRSSARILDGMAAVCHLLGRQQRERTR